MQIGKASYRKCPNCGEKSEYYKGPFFVHEYGLTEWSDGEKFEELPSFKKTELQRCGFCGHFIWFRQKLCQMTFKDYCDALIYFEELYSKKTLFDYFFPKSKLENLLYIRLNILRKYNNKIRIHPLSKIDPLSIGNNKKPPIDENDKIIFINNAIKLIELLKILEPENYFLRAELYRNIGSFEESKAELNKLKDESKKSLLLREIENKNCDVIIIKQPKKRLKEI